MTRGRMTLPNDVARCNAVLDDDTNPVIPCCTCARFVMRYPYSASKTQWMRPVPAFHNGTRYVCDKYMEIKNGQ